MAKEKELNKWCSLKKTVQYRPEHVEANEVKIYEERGRKIHLKRKILPSLFTEEELQATQVPSSNSIKTENEEISQESDVKVNQDINIKQKSKKNLLVKEEHNLNDAGCEESVNISSKSEKVGKKNKKKGKITEPSHSTTKTENVDISQESDVKVNQDFNIKQKSKKNLLVEEEHNVNVAGFEENVKVGKKNKKKSKIVEPSHSTTKTESIQPESSNVSTEESNNQTDKKETQNEFGNDSLSPRKGKKNKKKRKQESLERSNENHSTELLNQSKKRKSQFKNDNRPAKKRKSEFDKSTDIGISDARLKAYGLNPKKFKNKLKYKK